MKYSKDFDKVKIGRNDSCPCGSGLKYKKCCLERTEPPPGNVKGFYLAKYKIRLKEQDDIQGIRKTGRLVVDTLDMVEENLKAGITTDEIDKLVHDFTVKNGAKPAPLHYKGYPKSSCISVNHVICHGVPGKEILKDSDIVNVDITTVLNGYYADANKTFFIGKPDEKSQKIVKITRECLKKGMEMVKPKNTIGDLGWAIQYHAEKNGCSVVRDYVGHGVGFAFHESPQVPHYGKRGDGITLVPGMVFTVEPMINMGEKDVEVLKDKWTAVTKDGSLSAQFEQTVLVTEYGFESLTPYELGV